MSAKNGKQVLFSKKAECEKDIHYATLRSDILNAEPT